MVSFRFHLVSLIAVFLALALGIGMGVTVIDKATVDLLQQRLDTVRKEVAAANSRSDELNLRLDRSNRFEDVSKDYLVKNQLTGVPVSIVAARGFDTDSLNELKGLLAQAGASVQGTLWIEKKLELESESDASSLQGLLAAPNAQPTDLRSIVATRVNSVLAGASDGAALKPLADAGFIDWQGDRAASLEAAALAGSRVLIASSASNGLLNEQFMVPLTRSVATADRERRAVAIETGKDADSRSPAERAVFLAPLRNDSALKARLSTVDDVETSPGRVATVLALAQLPVGRTGNYGVGQSVDNLIPPQQS